MDKMMKEVVVVEPHKVEVREVPVPVPGADEVLIQMKFHMLHDLHLTLFKRDFFCKLEQVTVH